MLRKNPLILRTRIGISLLELLVVISIIALLMGLVLVGLQAVRLAAQRTERAAWHDQRKLNFSCEARRAPLKILFIGNSYTESNDLLGAISALAESQQARPEIQLRQLVVGGARLKSHWDTGEAQRLIESDQWDFVVLQEQSQTPLEYYGKFEYFYPYAHRFVTFIKDHDALPLFFMTWQRPDTPFPAQDWIASYTQIGRETESEVAPCGLAFEKARRALPGINLYADAGGHPNELGTYLAALTFFAWIYDRDPVGLPGSITTSNRGLTLSVPESQRLTLQQAARDASREIKKKIRPQFRSR